MPKLRIRLANAVIARLRELGTSSLRKLVASDEPEEQQFWAAQGFEADMVVMSNYDQSEAVRSQVPVSKNGPAVRGPAVRIRRTASAPHPRMRRRQTGGTTRTKVKD